MSFELNKSTFSNYLLATLLVFSPQVATIPLIFAASAAIAQQGLNADPTERWKSWQSAGDATVQTPQLRDGNVARLTPAEIIYYSGLENNVNPVLLLVKVQHEQGLLSTPSNDAPTLQRRLDRAAGFGIFDSSPDHTKWAGFYPQLVAASYQFGSIWKRTYKSSAEAVVRYSTDPQAGRKVAAIYQDYADKMNRVAGTRYPIAPSGWGHVDDFRDIGPAQIQAFLDLFPGNLKNRSLFGGGAVVNGPKVVNQPAIPPQIAKDQRLTFTVQTDKPADQVKITFQNPMGEAPLTGSGTQWTFDRPISVAGSRPWAISAVAAGKVTDDRLRGTLTVVDSGLPPGGTSAKVVLPFASMPGTTQPFANRLDYKTSACYFKGLHTGVDYAPVSVGQAVMAIADGRVAKVGQIGRTANSLGSYVVVEHPALGIRSLYLHVVPNVGVGASVRAGEKVAAIAATTAVGKHLHLEIQKFDFKVRDDQGKEKLFVGGNTAPIGQCGYVSRPGDLDKGWVNPAEFLKHPVSLGGQGQEQQNAEDVEEDDIPALGDRRPRVEVVKQILSELAKTGHVYQGSLDDQARQAGLIESPQLSQSQLAASRMEVALFIHRLLKKLAPTSLVASGNRFPIEEFADAAGTNAITYQQTVNELVAAGIVNGAPDSNGELRFYPQRKASATEIQALIGRAMSKISQQPPGGAVGAQNPKVVNQPAIPPQIAKDQRLTFTVQTDKPADQVKITFQNPLGEAPLTGSGTQWTFDRSISVAGSRPWAISVVAAGRVTDDRLRGTLTVVDAGQGSGSNSNTQPTITGVQVKSPLMINTPGTIVFVGTNLNADVRVTLADCENGRTQLISPTQISHQCVPRKAGLVSAGWKANTSVANPVNAGTVTVQDPSAAVAGSTGLTSKVDAFVSTWTGKPVDVDKSYGYQCVDLMHQYAKDVLGKDGNFAKGNAHSIFVNTNSPNLHKTANSPTAVPAKGDVIFWKPAPSNGNAGHVAIFVSGDAQQFTSFDQNFCSNSGAGTGPCAPRLVNHNYDGVAGWISTTAQTQPTPPPTIPSPVPPIGISAVQPQGNVVIGQLATFIFVGANLSNDVKVTVANCDNPQTQLLNPTQIRHQCIPMAAGPQAVGWKANGAEPTVRPLGTINVAAPAPTPTPAPAPVPVPTPIPPAPQPVQPTITGLQPQGTVMVNVPATLIFTGQNLTPDVRVTLASCDNPQTQLLNATQIRHQCTPRAVGPQAVGWKANGAEPTVRPLGTINVAAPAPTPVPTPVPTPTPPAPQPVQPNITGLQPQGTVMVNTPATLIFTGQNLTPDVRVTLANCDNPQTQLLNANQIRHQCTPRAVGPQAVGWKANGAEPTVRPLGSINVAAPAPTPLPMPVPTPTPPAPQPPPMPLPTPSSGEVAPAPGCGTSGVKMCGVDGRTYPNACTLMKSGVAKRANGPC